MRRNAAAAGAAAWLLIAATITGCVSVQPEATPTSAPPSDVASPTLSPTSSPAPSPTPSPTVAPTPTAVPTPAPTPVSGDVVLARFISGFLDEQPDFYLACWADVDIFVGEESGVLSVYMEGGISGENFSGSFSMQTESTTVEADMVILDGLAYVRPARGEWVDGEDYEQTQPLNPFSSDITDSVVYLGTATSEGEIVHNLRVHEWIGADLKTIARQVGLRRAKMESNVLDIYVRDDGLPVLAILEFTITGRYQGQPAEFVYYVTYEFSEIGEPVLVEAPI
jgi:hypothetical protein